MMSLFFLRSFQLPSVVQLWAFFTFFSPYYHDHCHFIGDFRLDNEKNLLQFVKRMKTCFYSDRLSAKTSLIYFQVNTCKCPQDFLNGNQFNFWPHADCDEASFGLGCLSNDIKLNGSLGSIVEVSVVCHYLDHTAKVFSLSCSEWVLAMGILFYHTPSDSL